MSREQDCFETGRAAFVMPHWMADDDMALRHFDEAVASVLEQTDPNWMLVIVDDHTGREVPLAHLRAVEAVLGPRGRVIYSDRRLGPGLARNLGIRAAAELGAPFILFLDADDLADPRRLERTRAAFCSGSDVNVVYSSHDFIDEYGHPIPLDSLAPTVGKRWTATAIIRWMGRTPGYRSPPERTTPTLLPVPRYARLWLWPSPFLMLRSLKTPIPGCVTELTPEGLFS